MPPKEEILKIRISESLKSQAKEVAELEGETLAVITRQALKEFIESRKKKGTNYGESLTENDKSPENEG